MAISYTWKIEWMQCAPTLGNYSDVVITAGYRCLAQDTGTTATAHGIVTFAPPEEDFTAYADLTEQQVLGWVLAQTDKCTKVEESLAHKIDELKNPPAVYLPLPWSK